MSPIFDLERGTSPLIVSIPHAGRELVPGLEKRLTSAGQSLIDTDWWLERLYDLPFFRVARPTILRAKLSRTVIDLNRDPAGTSLYPGQATTGLVPLETFDGDLLYRQAEEPDSAEIAERRDRYFWPYHRALAGEIARLGAEHGVVVLYDAHSIRSMIPRLFTGELPVLNLGTDDGRSCAPELQRRLGWIMNDAKTFPSIINGRFKGGWITRHYGQPDRGVHAVQMEIAARAYMSEAPPFAYNDGKADTLRLVLTRLLTRLHNWALENRKVTS